MKTWKPILIGMACASVLLLSGCVKLWHKTASIKTYMIEAKREAPLAINPSGDKLWIDDVTVLPPYNIRSLIMRKSAVQYEASYYSELLLAPPDNFRNNFFTWFSSSEVFKEVSLSSRFGMSHKMEVSILKFYVDTFSKPRQAVLEIKVSLFDERSKEFNSLFSKAYTQRVDLGNEHVTDLILAYNTALQQILTEVEKDVVEVL
jgi:ABC-type uncharacterized transport system auxiliary subunit